MNRGLLNLTFGTLIALPLLVLAPSAQAMSNKPASGNVVVSCAGKGAAPLHQELCASLRSTLSQNYPNHQFTQGGASNGLDLKLNVTKVSDTSITARLEWRGSASGKGPEITAGVRGSTLGKQQYDMLSKSLLKTTNLPL